MYIYELPFDINRELCRLLDMDDTWKELAGEHMKYNTFNIIEIEQAAKRKSDSPTHQLFTRWGQLNHNVKELFILLYFMKHVPALRCLVRVVEDDKFHQLLAKLERKNCSDKQSNDENGNVKVTPKPQSGLIPLPVMMMQMKGEQSVSASNGRSATSQSEASSTYESKNTPKSKPDAANNTEVEIAKNASSLSMFSYEKLTEATDNWSEKNLLGSGGFGEVFKGVVICLPVAIKRLKNNDKRNLELIRELFLNQYRHDNILALYGYSIGGPEACLIYQLMAGGSLQQRIYYKISGKHGPLSWPQRYRIALGVANGLVYLHNKDNDTPLIHGDIKPANILLDTCLMPKIGDFGLAKIGVYGDDGTHLLVSKPIGTSAYLPKEYLLYNELSRELDTYSYGVVLLELATAKLPARKKNQLKIPLTADILECVAKGFDLALLEDPAIKGTMQSNPDLCRELMKIGLDCAKERRPDRPPMMDVYRRLNALEFPGKNYS